MTEVFELIEPELVAECLNCYQDLTKLTLELRISCQNGHSQLCYDCMTKWRSECLNRYQRLTCPICRAEFTEAELAKLPEVVDKWMPSCRNCGGQHEGIGRILPDLYTALLHADGDLDLFSEEDSMAGYRSLRLSLPPSLPLYHRYRYQTLSGSPRYDTAGSGIEEVDGDRVGIINGALTSLNWNINTIENIASASTKAAITAEIKRREKAVVSKTTKAQLSEKLGLPVVSRRTKKRSRV